jgi:hypothetical protein
MKLFLAAAAIAAVAACGFVSRSTAAAFLFDGKEQPKTATLNKTPRTTKSPDKNKVPFDHVTHSTKAYSPDGKSIIGCAECHHTDQPKSALKGVLKTSERDEVLTTESLAKAAAKSVKTCASCHAQADVKPASLAANPVVTYPDDDDPVTLTNEEAYHRNCNSCHAAAKKANAATKAPTTCANCHNGQ